MLDGKRIIVGVTGGIAAYKAAVLVRLLVRGGAEVQVLMTPAAKAFITPLTMATLSKRPVLTEFHNPENGDWHSHVDLGLWADLLLVAPATANTLAKMAAGIADNLLLTTCLSVRCPVMVAPAMDLDMYRHPATQRNLSVLRGYGDMVVEPEEGELASGLVGKGRMAEPEEIFRRVEAFFARSDSYRGKRVLVTAGPTREKIDPVRFIGNCSTGKMGFALAEAFAARGAEVVLVAGPVALSVHHVGIRRVDVVSAEEMYEAVVREAAACDVVVACAAVADFTPVETADRKIKRGEENLQIALRPTRDIDAELGRRKKTGQLLVGFALETDHERENALRKMEAKNLDVIVLNSLNDPGAGFGGDTNKVTVIRRDGTSVDIGLKSKREVAEEIVEALGIYDL